MFDLLRTLNNGHELSPFSELRADFARPLLGWGAASTGPDADIYETADAVRVVVDLPGYAADSIAIEFEKDILSISAERKRDADGNREGDGRKGLLLGERTFGKVRRTFSVNVPVDGAAIAAHYDRGVLTVTLPKRAEAKPRKIEVTVK